MTLRVPIVWTDDHRLHVPGGETWIGTRIPGDEVPERAEAIREALVTAGAEVVAAAAHDDAPLHAVHDERLVAFLRGAWDAWLAAGFPDDPGQDRVVGYIFPTPGLTAGVRTLEPAAPSARTGLYAFDTMTPIGPGTWRAARAAVDCALTAADLAADRGEVVYALTRPPGHHATRSAYGGSCYLNNAAVAAQRLRARGARRVALLDVDAHHGNGAQAIFWERGDVLTGSVHVDPAAGWFPHFLGLADEQGAGGGVGANRNLPLAPGTGDAPWVAAVEELAGWARAGGVEALVVALGVDAAAGDPESPLEVTADGYRAAGLALGRLRLPTVVVQEGGYDLATIGGLVLAALEGLDEGRRSA